LARLIGRGRALEMFVTGERIRANEALAWGLISKVSAEGELRDDAFRIVRSLAR
jgi:enoyl-CoA hydratase/carnithine racemase